MSYNYSNFAIRTFNLVKEYQLYHSNKDRLKEFFNPYSDKLHSTFTAIDNVTLDIKQGESIGVIGLNGSGKSTLLKIISGITFPTSGSLEVNGQVSSILELGVSFNQEMTGKENIYLHGILHGYTVENIAEKYSDIVSFADIGSHIDQPVKSYSSGMLSRLAFACLTSIEKDIFIVDEALAVGDAHFQRKCFDYFNNFKKKREDYNFCFS